MVYSAVGAEFGVKLGALKNNFIFTYKNSAERIFHAGKIEKTEEEKNIEYIKKKISCIIWTIYKSSV